MTDYLTNEEIIVLEKDLRRSYFMGLLVGFMVLIICFILVLDLPDAMNIQQVLLIVGLFLSVLACTHYFTKNLRSDISKGLKELVEYEILDKSAFEDDDPGLGGSKITYHLKTNNKKFSVNKDLYYEANIHDYVIEHLAPITGQLLKLELKKNASLQQRVL